MNGMGKDVLDSLDGLDQVVIVPNYLFGNKPLDPLLDKIDTSLTIGAGRVEVPLRLSSSVMFCNTRMDEDPEVTKGLIYGASQAGIPYSIGGENLNTEMRRFIEDVNAKFILQWSSDRSNINADLLTSASAIEILIQGGTAQDINTMKRTGNIHPSMHLDIESPKDLKKHIDLIKEITANMVPVIVTIGPGNVYGDVKYCIKAGADAVNLGLGAILDSPIPDDFKKTVGLRTLSLFKPALKAMKETKAQEDNFRLLVSGGFTTTPNVFKVMAMGADGISLNGLALNALIPGGGSEAAEKAKDWKSIGEGVAKNVKRMESDLLYFFAICSAPSKDELTPDSLRASTYDAAAVSGLKLMGYDKTLPMWMH